MHGMVGTSANVADVTQVDQLLHGEQNAVGAEAGYTGVEKRPEHAGREVIWQIAARRSTSKKLSKRSALYKAKRKIEKAKAQVGAKVEHLVSGDQAAVWLHQGAFLGLAKISAQLMLNAELHRVQRIPPKLLYVNLDWEAMAVATGREDLSP